MRPRSPGTASQSRAKERSQSQRRAPPTAVPGKRWPGCFWNAIRCLAAEKFFYCFSLRMALSGTVALERRAVSRLGLDDVAVFGCDGGDAEVPDAEVDGLVGDDLHEGELAEVEGLPGGDFEALAAGEGFGGGLDDVALR